MARFRIGEIVLYWDGKTKEVLTGRKKWLPVRVISLPVPDAGCEYGLEGLYGTADSKEGQLRKLFQGKRVKRG